VKKTIELPSFLSLYSFSFSFNQGSEGLDDIRVTITKKEEDDKKGLETTRAVSGREVKVCEGTINNVLGSEIKGNETRKDYNTLIDPIIVIANVRSIFNY
jgi:hypothetical protein